MRSTVDFGIDLGTSNSAVAVLESGSPRLLSGADGRVLLPSAVWVGADGRIEVGAAAHASRFTDPANTAIEFKRQMGTADRIPFPAAGRSYSPVELSALILGELCRRAEAANGQPLRAAVITIPAMFQLPQCEATREAAARAGIEFAPLLQEPIAAAIAHAGAGHTREGHWLVYDLGGGTFDVSLVRARGGRLQVLDHDGDNHLGGKDFNRLLARWAADVVRSEGKAGEFRRTDPALAVAYARLAAEAERVRIKLSEVDQVTFAVPDLVTGPTGPVGLSVVVDRGLLESLITPTILRTTALCQTLLSRNRITSAELKGVVLVGGPTNTPCLPQLLERELGLPVRHAMDPTTIVAAGAALFAATQKLPASLRSGGAGLELEYEAMTTNPRPLLVGTVRDVVAPAELTARVTRSDGGFDSGALAVSPTGTFTAPLAVRKGELNTFELAVTRRTGNWSCSAQFSILHGLSIAKPPLSQSVGVMLADNSVRWYLRKGLVLPATATVTQTTAVRLARGHSGDAVRVPLVQGESDRADRNAVIGVLAIRADGITHDLPAGSEVRITLTVDEFSRTTARAYVPLLDQWFDQVVKLDAADKQTDDVAAGLAEQRNRLRQLESQADSLAATETGDLDARIGEVEALIADGDRDSVEVADQLVRMMTQQLDRAEAVSRADKLRADFADQNEMASHVFRTALQRRELDALHLEFETALAHGDADAAQIKFEAARSLVFDARVETPEFWRNLLNWLYGRFKSLDMLGLVQTQFQEGIKASEANDLNAMSRVCNTLFGMLPNEDRTDYEAVKSNIL